MAARKGRQDMEPTHTTPMISAAWLAALLRDVAIIVAVIVYAIDTL
jgi:hypothetical protein